MSGISLEIKEKYFLKHKQDSSQTTNPKQYMPPVENYSNSFAQERL